jgi:hypothetical protein
MSCEYHQSINKDLKTGATSRGDGLSCDEVLIEIDGNLENRNEFTFGEKIHIQFNNIEGLTTIDSLMFPGLSMHIIENNGDTLVAQNDLMSSLGNGTNLSPLQLTAKFRAAMPSHNNQQYKAIIKIWDKKGEGSFTYELPFKIIPDKTLEIITTDLTFDNIYLWNGSKNQPIVNGQINKSDETILLLNGLKGFTEQNGLVYPKISLEIVDNEGTELVYSENLLSDVEESGVQKENLEGQLPITITFTAASIVNPVKIKAIISDLNSEHKIQISGNLTLE